jgi:sterol desaturase/sphingolipid hydroxylase (fatty acid hydroxylase superfamily)
MTLENETLIRLSVFIGLFIVLATAERIVPRRPDVQLISKRWATNWMISITNILALRLVALAVPFLALGAALDAQMHGIGLLNLLDIPVWLSWVLTLLVMDFVIWLQHVVTHKWPLLWRLQQVHHADT